MDSRYQLLHHGLGPDRPVRIRRDRWTQVGPGMSDLHYDVELGIVLRGRMTRDYQDHSLDLRRGDIWLNGIWEPHSAQVLAAPLELLLFHIDPDALMTSDYPEAPGVRWLAPFQGDPAQRIHPFSEGRALSLAIAERAGPLVDDDSWAGRLGARLLLLEYLSAILQRWTPPRMRGGVPAAGATGHGSIEPAIRLVLASRQPVRLAEAARACDLGRSQFSERFTRLMGVPFGRFELRHRLGGATRALARDDQAIKTIAAEWGFSGASHLTRQFKDLHGVTPAAYRDRIRG